MEHPEIDWKLLGVQLTKHVLRLRRAYGLRFSSDRANEFAQQALAEFLDLGVDFFPEILSDPPRLRTKLERFATNIVRREGRSSEGKALRFIGLLLGDEPGHTGDGTLERLAHSARARDFYEVMPQEIAEPSQALIGVAETPEQRVADLQRELEAPKREPLLEVFNAVLLHNRETPAEIASHLEVHVTEIYHRLRRIRRIIQKMTARAQCTEGSSTGQGASSDSQTEPSTIFQREPARKS